MIRVVRLVPFPVVVAVVVVNDLVEVVSGLRSYSSSLREERRDGFSDISERVRAPLLLLISR